MCTGMYTNVELVCVTGTSGCEFAGGGMDDNVHRLTEEHIFIFKPKLVRSTHKSITRVRN